MRKILKIIFSFGIIAVFGLFVLSPRPAQAAIAFDASSTSGTDFASNATSLSWTHTTIGNDRLLFVACGMNDSADADANVTNVTYGGVAGTEIRRDVATVGADGSEIWYKVNPALGANTVSVTFAGTVSRAGCAAVSLTGVDQTNPLDAHNGITFANNAAPSVSVTTVADNAWILDVIYVNLSNTFGDAVPGAGQTERFEINAFFDQLDGSSEGPVSPAGATSMSWSGLDISAASSISAASFKPAAVGDESPATGSCQFRAGKITIIENTQCK
jgi:hypothetical protein